MNIVLASLLFRFKRFITKQENKLNLNSKRCTPKLIVRPSFLISKFSPGFAAVPPSIPKGRRVRLSDRIPAVIDLKNSSCNSEGTFNERQSSITHSI